MVTMGLYEKIQNREEKLALVGLGYVGMPIAVAFAAKGLRVIGFDLNKAKIELYQSGIDPTKEVGDDVIAGSSVEFTSDETKLREAKFHIVAVPTPVNDDHTPDLTPVESASRIVGRNLTKGSIVVYESTVYPGVTEEVCVPILEKESGLICGVDFKVGYSPERINPGDKVHRLETITKIVSGMDEETLDVVSKVYELVVEAGVYPAESIKVATTGSGDCTLRCKDSGTLDIQISGSGDITVSGTARAIVNISTTGSGDFNMNRLTLSGK
jgi:UDP-N-acetyl-D-galactosamine dehydrogenase